MKLFHSPGARSCRVRWLLEELGQDYELVPVSFQGGAIQDPELLAVNPLGKIPVLIDGDVTLCESGAIVEYLLETYDDGALAPRPGDHDRPEFLQWLHWSEATLLPPIGELAQNLFLRPEDQRIAAVVPDAQARLQKALSMLDGVLADREWMVGGRFSAADIMMAYSLQLAKMLGQLPEDVPNVTAYLERCSQQPNFGKAFGA